jgi:hypothetical protein
VGDASVVRLWCGVSLAELHKITKAPFFGASVQAGQLETLFAALIEPQRKV